jgi:hypothetical protein
MDTWRWRYGNIEAWKHGNMEKWRHGDGKHGDMDMVTWTWRHGHGDMGKPNGKRKMEA